MANKRIKDLGTTASTLAADDYIAVDGNANGTRKIVKGDLVNDISTQVAGTYLDEANNLSDVASKDTSKLNLEVPDVGTAPNEVPLNGQLGSMAYQSADSVAMGTVEADSLEVDGQTKSGSLNVYDSNGNASNSLDLTYSGSSGVANIQADSNGGNTQLTFGTSNAGVVGTRATIDSSGNVTVASGDVTATAGQFNSGASNASTPGFAVSTGNGIYNSGANQIGFSTNSTQRAVIDSSGRIGQAGVTPGSYHANADNLVLANEGLGGDTGLTIRSGTSGTGAIHFADGTSGTDRYRGYVSYTQSSDTLNFATSGTARWSIGSGGVLLGAAGNGIRFDTGTTLDAYEEGLWSATLTPSTSGTITVDGSVNALRYTIVGRVAHIQGKLSVTAVSSPVGNSVKLSLPTAVGVPDINEQSGSTVGSVVVIGAAGAMNGYTLLAIEGDDHLRIYKSTSSTTVATAPDFSGDEQVYINATYIIS